MISRKILSDHGKATIAQRRIKKSIFVLNVNTENSFLNESKFFLRS